jgi:hypothetical protein
MQQPRSPVAVLTHRAFANAFFGRFSFCVDAVTGIALANTVALANTLPVCDTTRR